MYRSLLDDFLSSHNMHFSSQNGAASPDGNRLPKSGRAIVCSSKAVLIDIFLDSLSSAQSIVSSRSRAMVSLIKWHNHWNAFSSQWIDNVTATAPRTPRNSQSITHIGPPYSSCSAMADIGLRAGARAKQREKAAALIQKSRVRHQRIRKQRYIGWLNNAKQFMPWLSRTAHDRMANAMKDLHIRTMTGRWTPPLWDVWDVGKIFFDSTTLMDENQKDNWLASSRGWADVTGFEPGFRYKCKWIILFIAAQKFYLCQESQKIAENFIHN